METGRSRLGVLLAGLFYPAGLLHALEPPYFTNVTAEVGLSGIPGFRLSIGDLDGDGYPDFALHRRSDWATGDVRNKQYLFLNVPGDNPADPYSRKFIDYTASSGIRANRQGTGDGRHSDSAVFADVDNDGDLDMFTVVYVHDNYTLATNTNELLLNDGQAHFTLAPNSPFHLEPIYNTAAAVFVEYDNDGKVDLYIGNWYWNGALTRDQLYRGGGNGSFTNATTASGLGSATTSVYGIAAFDWNNDGFTDLFAPAYAWTVLNSVSLHWRNNGNGTFTRVEATTNYDDYRGTLSGVASFGSMPRDFDNDGDTDFLEILTHGQGDGPGEVHSTAVANVGGVFSWDFYRVDGRAAEDPDSTHHGDHYICWFDFDNDTLVDFALTESGYNNNRLYLFKQAADHTFHPVTVDSGLDPINEANLPPHNVLAMDYDLDGDEDLLVGFANNTDGIQLWRNDVGTDNNWIVLTLEGGGGTGQSNRSAIGARVELAAGGTTQTREVDAGSGHHGPQVPLSLGFGLGQASVVDTVTVRWPNQERTSVSYVDLPVNRFLRIREACSPAGDPTNLKLGKDADDVVLHWDAPAELVWDWNVYRDGSRDPGLWGLPHASHVTDEDLSTSAIQYRDAGAVGSAASYYYLVTAVNDCGETPFD
jgi:hypothetical protein